MRCFAQFALCIALSLPLFAAEPAAVQQRRVRIRDLATVEGVRENSLVGYGLVVGLNGTGDRDQTIFTTQALSSVLQRLGVQIPPTGPRVKNIAAVLVTAKLPPFAAPGTSIDVSVSSIGDATSLNGGTLLVSPLRAVDGEIYATAQGPLALGGFSAGNSANAKQVNHPTSGRIPNGATVERNVSNVLSGRSALSLILREQDFSTAHAVETEINHEMMRPIARAVDARRIELTLADDRTSSVPALLALIEDLSIPVRVPSRVVVNERTGTVVMGKEVRLGAVSILHGGLTVEISTTFNASQPNALAKGDTVVVPEQKLTARESNARRIELPEGASVEQLVNGLQTIGATSRDIISILQALKAAGALQSELEVL